MNVCELKTGIVMRNNTLSFIKIDSAAKRWDMQYRSKII